MKSLRMFLLICLLANSSLSLSQLYPFSDPIRLTDGNNDRNPSFANSREYDPYPGYEWEFMTFERISGSASNICVSRIGVSGSVGEEYYITSDSYINKNPSIAYNRATNVIGPEIKYAVIVWQSDRFGRQSIFASRYINGAGWSVPFIVDSSNADNVTPKICSIDSLRYSIVYQRGQDIMYKRYNILTNVFSPQGNTTILIPEYCSNPNIKSVRFNAAGYSRIFVSFDREIAAGHTGVYFATGLEDSIPVIDHTDSIAVAGNNRNLGFGFDNLDLFAIFESDRNGVSKNIYGTRIIINYQTAITGDSAFDCLNYTGSDFDFNFNYSTVGLGQNTICAYNLKTLNDLKIKFILNPDSSSVIKKISNDPLYHTSISMNGSIRIPNTNCEKRWFVFNKDSVDINYPSTIYGVFYTNCLTKIIKNEYDQPSEFSLEQNYPNPFNPVTHLGFEISKLEFVTLKVYDVLGHEIKTLVNEIKSPGVYKVEFDGSNLASGIYYYKLTTGEFSEVKKMTLLK